MEAAIRKPMTINLNIGLIERLKKLARRENSSVDSYVESLLLDATYYEPNAETIAAIEEVKRGEYVGEVDLTSIESMIKSIEG